MTQLEQQMLNELSEAQNFVYELSENLITQGVSASNTEGLDTLVPKVLQIDSGVTKPPYDEWQEGFGANWDSVIQNAPQDGVNPVLHIYSKVNSIRHSSNFSDTIKIVTYNPTTGIYRPVTVDANKNLFFEESDYFINNHDGLSYICVIYKAPSGWQSWHFRMTLPVVYSNSKGFYDNYVNLIAEGNVGLPGYYPYLRGIDCNLLNNMVINSALEHLSVQNYSVNVQLMYISGGDTQARILKNIYDNAPVITTFTIGNALVEYCALYISDEKLADWFYNDFVYNRYTPTSYRYGFPVSNVVKKYKIKPDIQFAGNNYLNRMPNMIYIDGFITENQTKASDINAGVHNFTNNGWRMLQNFPMWTVLDGANTGCLLPRPQGSTAVTNANFLFYSTNLERKYFCEFDENGTIIEDPEKYFLCNLPVQQYVTGQSVRFVTNAFWSLFTADEISEIERYIGLKNWAIIWQ